MKKKKFFYLFYFSGEKKKKTLMVVGGRYDGREAFSCLGQCNYLKQYTIHNEQYFKIQTQQFSQFYFTRMELTNFY